MKKSIAIENIFEAEREHLMNGCGFVIGIDEAGRGPLVGPVVSSAVLISQKDLEKFENFLKDDGFDDKIFDLIRDSKKLSEKQREKIYEFILNNFSVGIGICDHRTIDNVNILQATFLAMKKAVFDLKTKFRDLNEQNSILLVDGNKEIPNFSFRQKPIISGDSSVKVISAASIVAKVYRDKMMVEMHNKYPDYGFDKHKGYGTKMHLEALAKFGPCEFHRKSFSPVGKFSR